jgi:hypothetical protein
MAEKAHLGLKRVMGSSSRRLAFEVEWIDSLDGVEVRTLAYFKVAIDGLAVWPIRGEESEDIDGFELYADELLAHLTECWKPLLLRQNYPIPVLPMRPSYLHVAAAERWANRDILKQDEEAQLAAFDDVHNLVNAFGGVSGLPALWFLRDRDGMIIDTTDFCARVSFDDAKEALTRIGEAIAARLRETSAEKWSRLLGAWQRRDEGDENLLLALTIGRDTKTAATLVSEKILEAPKSFEDAANDLDELRIAARMAGPLPLGQITTILQKLKECNRGYAPKLKEMSAKALEFVRSGDLANAPPSQTRTRSSSMVPSDFEPVREPRNRSNLHFGIWIKRRRASH